MQISSLVQVINYLQEKSADPSITEGYRKLSEMISKKSDAGEISPEILKEKQNLKSHLLESDPSDWGASSYSLFEKMNQHKLFGKAGADHLDNIINADGKDLVAIGSALAEKNRLISELPGTLLTFMQLFRQVVPEDVTRLDAGTENKFTLYLYFGGNLSVQNIAEMERYTELWNAILENFSKLTGEVSCSLDIATYNNGNFTLGVDAGENIMKAMASGVTGMLDSLSLIHQIRKTQIDISRLPLNKDFNQLLDEEIQVMVHQKAKEIACSLVSEFQSINTDQEMINDISRSLKQILNFVEKGGKIEFRPRISTGDSAKINRILTDSFALASEIKGLSIALNPLTAITSN